LISGNGGAFTGAIPGSDVLHPGYKGFCLLTRALNELVKEF
jgi:hypothetical protein